MFCASLSFTTRTTAFHTVGSDCYVHIRLYVAQLRMRKSVILQYGAYTSLGNSDCYVTWCIYDVSATHAIILFRIKRVF